MTPTEQDKELREKIKTIIIGFDGGNWYDEKADSIMQLITADRKRVALEARLQGVSNSCDAYYDFPAPDLNNWFDNEMRDIKEEIAEAQQEEV